MDLIQRELEHMRDTGKISTNIGAKNIGRGIDLHNQTIEDKKERKYSNEITARNKYFWKLFLWNLKNPGEDYKSQGQIVVSPKSKEGGEN
ncbi:hypothetical protein AKJ59_00395 [candidate division MSBL1 archaeon SCGC-AAA385M02]|uniref:Uncharacterized protein n=1 Tax=candidate division MSBL1 archaeon SCGC-AAA385M02 TaxID=1698287 RepID=A0A133VQX1_9EURY|nr:hypothetical protein AKJ59_00395 [candidate division MSBL1 archaeon SCGC-AAA385M02]